MLTTASRPAVTGSNRTGTRAHWKRHGRGSQPEESHPRREVPHVGREGRRPPRTPSSAAPLPLRGRSSWTPRAAPGAPRGRRSWRSACTGISWCPSASAGGPAGWSGRRRPCCSEGRCRASHLGEGRATGERPAAAARTALRRVTPGLQAHRPSPTPRLLSPHSEAEAFICIARSLGVSDSGLSTCPPLRGSCA